MKVTTAACPSELTGAAAPDRIRSWRSLVADEAHLVTLARLVTASTSSTSS